MSLLVWKCYCHWTRLKARRRVSYSLSCLASTSAQPVSHSNILFWSQESHYSMKFVIVITLIVLIYTNVFFNFELLSYNW